MSVHERTLDNNRYELNEILNNKINDMERLFELELTNVKKAYDEAVAKVDHQSKTLESSFRNKVHGIKEKSALFFAKIELKLKENYDEVLHVSQLFRQWQENMKNPQTLYEAQMFSVNSKIQQVDAERETEYSLIHDVMRKLVQALEDKTSHDLIE